MPLTLLKGYPDKIGKRQAWCGNYVGPKSYTTGGDPVTMGPFQNYIDSMHASLSVSGTYFIRPIPSAAGPRATWKAKWIVVATGNEAANALDLSAETVILDGLGGVY